jgi:membrane-associated phospholipid phosphatase
MTVTLLLAGLLLVAWIVAQMAPRLVAYAEGPIRLALDPSRSGLGRLAERMLGPHLAEAPLIATLGVLLIGGTWGFFAILEDVMMGDPIVGLDHRIYAALRAWRTPAGDYVMIAITELGDQQVFVPVAVAVLVFLALRKHWRAAIYLIITIAGSAIFVAGVKAAIKRPRPVSIYDGIVEYSFPSGHAAMTMVLLGFIGLLAMHGAAPRWRKQIAFVCLTAILWICMSRLYLGAHWFSDVAASLLFGLAWVALLGALHLRKADVPPRALELATVAVVTYLLSGGLHIAQSFAMDASKYAVSAAAPLPAAMSK